MSSSASKFDITWILVGSSVNGFPSTNFLQWLNLNCNLGFLPLDRVNYNLSTFYYQFYRVGFKSWTEGFWIRYNSRYFFCWCRLSISSCLRSDRRLINCSWNSLFHSLLYQRCNKISRKGLKIISTVLEFFLRLNFEHRFSIRHSIRSLVYVNLNSRAYL